MSKQLKFWDVGNDDEFDPYREWEGMPEFVQEKQEDCYHKITIRFRNEEDYQEFSELIGQKLTERTKSIWHPSLTRGADLQFLRYKSDK